MFQNNDAGMWISAISLYLYLLFFSSGILSYSFLINSEIFPVHIRATSMSISCAVYWLLNLVVTALFLILVEHPLAIFITFLFFFLSSILTLYASAKIIPETRCRTFSEINEIITKPFQIEGETLEEIRAIRSKRFPVPPPDRPTSFVNEV